MSAPRRLPSRLGCAPGAGLRSLGSSRQWWPTRWWRPWSSPAAGKAVPAGVAGQALPEPYVPGSGDRVPAELRLVLAGYAGIAGGLLAGALACATALVFFFFIYDTTSTGTTVFTTCCSSWPSWRFLGGFSWGLGLGLGRVFTRSGRISDFPLCCGGAAIHVRPR